MQIRRGCLGWKIGHPSFSDNLDPKEHKSAKKSILANDAHRSPFFDHKDLHYYGQVAHGRVITTFHQITEVKQHQAG